MLAHGGAAAADWLQTSRSLCGSCQRQTRPWGLAGGPLVHISNLNLTGEHPPPRMPVQLACSLNRRRVDSDRHGASDIQVASIKDCPDGDEFGPSLSLRPTGRSLRAGTGSATGMLMLPVGTMMLASCECPTVLRVAACDHHWHLMMIVTLVCQCRPNGSAHSGCRAPSSRSAPLAGASQGQ